MEAYPDTIFDDLDREWSRLRERGEFDRALARWRRFDDRLSSFRDLEQLIGLLSDRDGDPERQSDLLLALLTIAKDDRLAALVVLHRFVPSLKRIASWEQPFAHLDWAVQVVAEAFEVIATYPVERRPRKVAANIVLDVRKRMLALLSQHHAWQAELMREHPNGSAHAPDPADRVVAAQLLDCGRRHSGLSQDDAVLILLTRLAGFTVEEIAERVGIPSARLRQRRWRSERRIRAALPVA